MNVSDSLIIISHPSFSWVDLPEFFLLRNNQGLTSSHHFSHDMARSLTPTDPLESYLLRFLCVGFHRGEGVAICFNKIYDADIASGRCISPMPYYVLCVRFTSLVHAEKKINIPPEAQHSILVVG